MQTRKYIRNNPQIKNLPLTFVKRARPKVAVILVPKAQVEHRLEVASSLVHAL